jgi:hypothetical protein
MEGMRALQGWRHNSCDSSPGEGPLLACAVVEGADTTHPGSTDRSIGQSIRQQPAAHANRSTAAASSSSVNFASVTVVVKYVRVQGG